jgi:hypothetical protein
MVQRRQKHDTEDEKYVLSPEVEVINLSPFWPPVSAIQQNGATLFFFHISGQCLFGVFASSRVTVVSFFGWSHVFTQTERMNTIKDVILSHRTWMFITKAIIQKKNGMAR